MYFNKKMYMYMYTCQQFINNGTINTTCKCTCTCTCTFTCTCKCTCTCTH